MPAVARAGALLAFVGLAACHAPDYLAYSWDDRRVLCSDAIDDFEGNAPWALVADELEFARDAQRVALFHAHKPGVTISIAGIERILDLADKNHLAYVGYDELVPGPARAGLALAFDDNAVDEWLGIRDLLAAHHARVTFFVSRYTIISDEERAGLEVLAGDGHDLEPHSVTHPHAHAYVRDHGLDAYLADEADPSIRVLAAAGHAPTTYAFPFGEHSSELDDALLDRVAKIRVSPGSCPW